VDLVSADHLRAWTHELQRRYPHCRVVPSSRLTRRPPSPSASAHWSFLTPLPPQSARALPLIVGSCPSPFEATRPPCKGPP
jgi:hypothetical protein